MPFFTSPREKRLWIWALVVFATILSTLFIGQPLAKLFASQDRRAVFFVLGMILVGATIAIHAFKTKASKYEIGLWLGIVAVYFMFFLRLGLSERSHLIEYSVLAIFIHKAIEERMGKGKGIVRPALLAFLMTFLLGVVDESLQLLIPQRVFDPADILFNGMAAATAIGARLILSWARKRWGKDPVDP